MTPPATVDERRPYKTKDAVHAQLHPRRIKNSESKSLSPSLKPNNNLSEPRMNPHERRLQRDADKTFRLNLGSPFDEVLGWGLWAPNKIRGHWRLFAVKRLGFI